MMSNRDVGCIYERAELGSSAALRLGECVDTSHAVPTSESQSLRENFPGRSESLALPVQLQVVLTNEVSYCEIH